MIAKKICFHKRPFRLWFCFSKFIRQKMQKKIDLPFEMCYNEQKAFLRLP